ncbi:serine hydrolase domain-containing protein [Gephyromycinifex aptenodytis]|uniref:serine hydrolase domain-containing protein n=1 Tax=Gephyromycinifex aptenodytis TaxID=2716227 RepID=UPI0014451F36|nr:serine hydrolase domain-containing protein [Gephyromycinifex aptenodytis]
MDLAAAVKDWPVGSASVAVITAEGGIVDVHDDGRSYPWASITKVATALTVLDGCLEGVISLDDEVGPATLAHLLSHASGLKVDSDETMGPPQRRRIYSNRGINLAAEHLAAATGTPFTEQLRERLLDLLDMNDTRLEGPPAHGMVGTIGNLAALAAELLNPTLLMPQTVAWASTLAFPGLDGVLPGFGTQKPNDWGLGCEIRANKSPHWTAPENSPATFGHFGQSGSFCWVDPQAGVACVSLCDTPFGDWAAQAWPMLSTAVLAEYGG